MLMTFDSIGYLHSKLTEKDLRPIKEEISLIEKNPILSKTMNGSLAGNLQKEFELVENRKYLYELILPYVLDFDSYFNYSETQNIINPKNYNLVLDKIWVNFQGPSEFNPVHRHTGLFSFVIWINLPYKMEDEISRFPLIDPKNVRAGTFNFYYVNSLGRISEKTFYCDKKLENNLLIFPSEMHHCVYPFYSSKEYRISVSGNLCLDI